jgi:fumarylacetoacetase
VTTSWIESANAEGCDFPLAHLPYGVFRPAAGPPRCGLAIGETVLDLAALEEAGLIDAAGGGPLFAAPSLNDFMALGGDIWAHVRERLTALLADGGDKALRDNAALRERALHAREAVTMLLPIRVSGYTDFNASRQHSFNAGSLLRGPQNALPRNWLHMPIGYNGRVSTIVISGTPIRRPLGQYELPDADAPVFGPCRKLDFELEMGAIVGTPTRMGEPISVEEADAHIFGYVLLNDWSARDIQAFETQPLGPFQGKAFGTTISPWVVTRAALEPFRAPVPAREKPLPPHLLEGGSTLYDISLEAAILPEGAERATTVTRTNFRHLYYTAAQMLAHHAIGGCRMDTGDLIGTGTISGPAKEEWASLLELTYGGRERLALDGGRERAFLEDGDCVVIRGHAQRGPQRVGFGECTGKILPSPNPPV